MHRRVRVIKLGQVNHSSTRTSGTRASTSSSRPSDGTSGSAHVLSVLVAPPPTLLIATQLHQRASVKRALPRGSKPARQWGAGGGRWGAGAGGL
eukprot:1679445-Prymnesium_polylepis.1